VVSANQVTITELSDPVVLANEGTELSDPVVSANQVTVTVPSDPVASTNQVTVTDLSAQFL
jgi:hypothetical protein